MRGVAPTGNTTLVLKVFQHTYGGEYRSRMPDAVPQHHSHGSLASRWSSKPTAIPDSDGNGRHSAF